MVGHMLDVALLKHIVNILSFGKDLVSVVVKLRGVGEVIVE